MLIFYYKTKGETWRKSDSCEENKSKAQPAGGAPGEECAGTERKSGFFSIYTNTVFLCKNLFRIIWSKLN